MSANEAPVLRRSYTRMTPEVIARMRDLRYGDGLTASATAAILGCSMCSVQSLAPGRPGKVPNDKLRAAFLSSGVPATEVARRLRWPSGHSWDASAVKRTLGLRPDLSGSNGLRSTRRMVDAETASLMAEAIGVAPWEVMPDEEVAA